MKEEKFPADNSFRSFFDAIERGERRIYVSGLRPAGKSFLTSILARRLAKTVLFITATEKEAAATYQDLAFFVGEERLLLYPPWYACSTDIFALQKEVTLSRMEVLCRLFRQGPSIVVAPINALLQKTLPRHVLADYVETVSLGDFRDRDALTEKMLSGGYGRVSLVEERGEFGVRGSIVDVFPPTEPSPLRLEFMGDELESIRVFDPASQRSLREVSDFLLFPAGEIILSSERKQLAVQNIKRRANELGLSGSLKNRLAESVANGFAASVNPLFLSLYYEAAGDHPCAGEESMGKFLDYLPQDSLVILDDNLALRQAEAEVAQEIDHFISKAREGETFYLEKESSFFPGHDFFASCGDYVQIHINGLSDPSFSPVRFGTERNMIPKEVLRVKAAESSPLAFLADYIKKHLDEGYLVFFLSHGEEERERMALLLSQHGISDTGPGVPFFEVLQSHRGRGRFILLAGRLSEGFHVPSLKLLIITEEEISGRKITRRKTRPLREGYFLESFGELNDGDYAVHLEHGVGLYRGLKRLIADGLENDFLLLEYRDGDKLYLPVYRLDLLQRYIGPGDYTPPLDKLGGSSWEAVKERVKASVREVAEELAAIYGARQVMEGHSFSLHRDLYDDFTVGFEYEETPDQAKAIEDVELDMAEVKPMDRLICGDAGFGKTEVALRAAFLAAMDGKQVVMLVPTTLLSEQHYQTFSRRLKDWPLRVEVMNRFRTAAEQKEIVAGIRQGKVDIAIGTHRLLQKDIAFKDLGLVIIDEEQRFGVTHKEMLKKLRTLVDVLTLTATPIPRTLHLAMIGIRDLTIINTPPEDRLPIKTYVAEFDEELIKEAIRSEIEREGQVFLLHDRVRSIHTMARLVERLVPEAQIGVVHGRMKAKEIEDVMARFVRRECNVLVCTTIVGAGLDIPTANTIIINRADRFGLSQLYQIKGRVGRAKEEGRAYLLIPKGMMLSRDARRRLQAIIELSEHGSGFRVAYQDLEIRGGGNILGTSQSGHISAVGYELYTELMEQSLREIKGEERQKEVKPEIHFGVAALIPAEYIADERRRLISYKRLSMAENDEELERLKAEMADCYGPVPPELHNLCGILGVQNLLARLKGTKMVYDKKNFITSFQKESKVDPARILKLAQEKWPGIRLTPALQLYVPAPYLKDGEILREAKRLLEALQEGSLA